MVDILPTAGIAATVSALVAWLLQTVVSQQLRERLARVESQLSTQSLWMAARLTRTDERRSLALSRLHTRLNSALRLTEDYIGSQYAGNPETHMEELRFACIRSWIRFEGAFERTEIFLSAELAERIHGYGGAIADVRVRFELRGLRPGSDANLKDRLGDVSEALEKLSRLKTDVRPQLVKEIRAALGADAIDVKASRPR